MVNTAPRRRMNKRTMWIVGGAAAAAGLAVASVMLWVAFQENPQGEFFDPVSGAVDWRYSFALFGLWFAVIAAPILFAGIGGAALRSRFRRRTD